MKRSFLVNVFIGTMLALIVVSIAFMPAQPGLKLDKINPTVLESDALYFKNLRQFYYVSKVDEKSQYNIFTHPDQKLMKPEAPRLLIVDNWMQDQAFILFELTNENGYRSDLVIKANSVSDTLEISDINVNESLKLASRIYEVLGQEGSQFQILDETGVKEIWAEPNKRSILQIILKDYFKLIGAV